MLDNFWIMSRISCLINLTGCVYNEPHPYVIDAIANPEGDVYSPGFDESEYPNNMFCDYSIKAAPGFVVKLTFVEMELEAAKLCVRDKVFVMDGPNSNGNDIGVFCGEEPPPYSVVSTKNGIHLSFRSDYMIGRKGFHAHYKAILPSQLCPTNHQKCRNNNCFDANEKCDGKDDCLDGTDEENCGNQLPSSKCGNGNILPIEEYYTTDRIVGGQGAREGSWPWQVDLQFMNFYPNSHYCGGTLLNAQWIMTAQHCLKGSGHARDWRVHVGKHHRFKTDTYEQVRYVEKIVMFPGYTGKEIIGKPISLDNDIALMKLSAPVSFNDHVRPACLPSQGEILKVGTKCFATGWGLTKGSGYHRGLKQSEVYVIPTKTCPGTNETAMICAKSRKGLQDICHGDSGGPLSCKEGSKWKVYGISSFLTSTNGMDGGGLCAVGEFGSVYNRVSNHITWIHETILKHR